MPAGTLSSARSSQSGDLLRERYLTSLVMITRTARIIQNSAKYAELIDKVKTQLAENPSGPHAGGPFNGTFRNLVNFQVAEEYICGLGYGKEFSKTEFVSGTTINERSVGRVLHQLVEHGIIASYQHPRYHYQSMYRVAWPVLRTLKKAAYGKGDTVTAYDMVSAYPPAIAITKLAEDAPKLSRYTVKLKHPEREEYWEFSVDAACPQEAAQAARESVRAMVVQVWENL